MVSTRSYRKTLRDESAKLEVMYRLLSESKYSTTLLKYILVYLAPQGGQKQLMDILFDSLKESKESTTSPEEFDVEPFLEKGMNLDFTSAIEAIQELDAKANAVEQDETVNNLFSFGED